MTTALAFDPQAAFTAAQARLGATTTAKAGQTPQAKARAQANDFEAVFVNSMVQHMFTGIDKEGPLGNGPGVGVWRSFLTEQYSKELVKAGGLGLSDQIYKSLLSQQEARGK
jgi:peptidoglycan hydrolase FlgJ